MNCKGSEFYPTCKLTKESAILSQMLLEATRLMIRDKQAFITCAIAVTRVS